MSVIRLYEELVGRGGLSPTYFFYTMTFAEASAYLKGMERKEHDEWERTRRMMWAMLLPHVKKSDFQPDDVMRFSWEADAIDTTKVDEQELERIRELAKTIKL